MTEQEIKFPFGDADKQNLVDAATGTVTIKNTRTTLLKEAGFAQAVTALSLLAGVGLMVGSQVVVRIEQNGTGRNVTFGQAGSPVTAPALTGVASDIDVITLEWTGTYFKAVTVWQKVFDFA